MPNAFIYIKLSMLMFLNIILMLFFVIFFLIFGKLMHLVGTVNGTLHALYAD